MYPFCLQWYCIHPGQILAVWFLVAKLPVADLSCDPECLLQAPDASKIAHNMVRRWCKWCFDQLEIWSPKSLLCTSATLFCACATGFWRTKNKTPFAPSPKHMVGVFEASGSCSRHCGSQDLRFAVDFGGQFHPHYLPRNKKATRADKSLLLLPF